MYTVCAHFYVRQAEKAATKAEESDEEEVEEEEEEEEEEEDDLEAVLAEEFEVTDSHQVWMAWVNVGMPEAGWPAN